LFDEDEDAWPDEPDEFDPYSLGPGIPTVKTSEADVPAEVFTAFWAAVLFANVALFAISLGLMLIGFRGDWEMGGPSLLIGVVALGFTFRTYYNFNNR
jgi:hypothetical protein